MKKFYVLVPAVKTAYDQKLIGYSESLIGCNGNSYINKILEILKSKIEDNAEILVDAEYELYAPYWNNANQTDEDREWEMKYVAYDIIDWAHEKNLRITSDMRRVVGDVIFVCDEGLAEDNLFISNKSCIYFDDLLNNNAGDE